MELDSFFLAGLLFENDFFYVDNISFDTVRVYTSETVDAKGRVGPIVQGVAIFYTPEREVRSLTF